MLVLAAVAVLSCPALRADNAPAAPTTPAASAAKSYDFGDQNSSTLATKAWAASAASDLAGVKAYTGRCFDLYQGTAASQQAALKGPPNTGDKDAVYANWALNDVGTCYFILGQALEKAGDTAGATKAYQTLVDKFSYAECWDTKGWFWSPADAARGRIKALKFDSMN